MAKLCWCSAGLHLMQQLKDKSKEKHKKTIVLRIQLDEMLQFGTGLLLVFPSFQKAFF
jgi:hypothetical protein